MKNKENQQKICGIYIGNNFSGIAINGKIISNQRIKNQTIIPTIIAFEKILLYFLLNLNFLKQIY